MHIAHTPASLASLLARAAVAFRDRQGCATARLAVDGPVRLDGELLADAVASALVALAVPVARVRAEDFLRSRALRLEHGDDPQAFLDGWYDLGALRREVLGPLGPGGSMRWLARLRDPRSDRSYRDGAVTAAPGTVAVLDGRFLARAEVADAVDVRVHLDVSAAARARRVPAAERGRVLPAWERYLELLAPAASAQIVVRFDRPSHPAVVSAR